MGQLGRSTAARTGLGIVAGVALLGGAFYGGRVYQNNVDQKLFAAYNPPQSNTGTRAGGTSFGSGGLGGGSSQNAQIDAALTVGNPPSSASSGSGATSSTAGQNAASTGQGGAAAAGTARAHRAIALHQPEVTTPALIYGECDDAGSHAVML